MDYIKDEILNAIATFCINHCYVYATTIYAILKKSSKGEIESYMSSLEEADYPGYKKA